MVLIFCLCHNHKCIFSNIYIFVLYPSLDKSVSPGENGHRRARCRGMLYLFIFLQTLPAILRCTETQILNRGAPVVVFIFIFFPFLFFISPCYISTVCQALCSVSIHTSSIYKFKNLMVLGFPWWCSG